MSGETVALSVAILCGCGAGLSVYEALRRLFAVGQVSFVDAAAHKGKVISGGSDVPAASERVFPMRKVLDSLSRLLERYLPLAKVDSEKSRDRLRRAGVALAPETWRSLRLVSAAGLTLLSAVLLSSAGFSPVPMIFLSTSAGVAGWMLPRAELSRRERNRREAIEARLPDAMELLGIALAAGSPIEQCFRELAATVDGPLAQEFALVDQEVNLLGHTRERALDNLADRCRSQDVTAFVAHITQAIGQGSSIAGGLALQAALARETAQADALERIRKMPTKLDIVLSLCFLPPTVVLVIVPTVVNLLNFLNESMS